VCCCAAGSVPLRHEPLERGSGPARVGDFCAPPPRRGGCDVSSGSTGYRSRAWATRGGTTHLGGTWLLRDSARGGGPGTSSGRSRRRSRPGPGRDYRHTYAVAADVTERTSNPPPRRARARGCAEHQLNAWTYHFCRWARTSGHHAALRGGQPPDADGVGFAVKAMCSRSATLFLHTLQEPATFSEMFTMDFTAAASS